MLQSSLNVPEELTTYLLYLLHEDTCHGFKMNGCHATYAEKYTCHVLKPYILLHFCVTYRGDRVWIVDTDSSPTANRYAKVCLSRAAYDT